MNPVHSSRGAEAERRLRIVTGYFGLKREPLRTNWPGTTAVIGAFAGMEPE